MQREALLGTAWQMCLVRAPQCIYTHYNLYDICVERDFFHEKSTYDFVQRASEFPH